MGRAQKDEGGFLFPMPEAENREETPMEAFEAFRADCERFGGLFRISDAAKILGVSDGTIRSYAKRGIVETVNHFGGVWVLGREVERRLTRPRGPGRPPKRAVCAA